MKKDLPRLRTLNEAEAYGGVSGLRERRSSCHSGLAAPPHSGCPAGRVGNPATIRVGCRSVHCFRFSNHRKRVRIYPFFCRVHPFENLSGKPHEQKYRRWWNWPRLGLNRYAISWGVEYCWQASGYRNWNLHRFGYYPRLLIRTRYHPLLLELHQC